MKRRLVPAHALQPGALFVTKDLIDGERRIKFFVRGDDAEEFDGCQNPQLWVRAKGLGFMQYSIEGRLRVRVRVGPGKGSTFIGRLTPVIAWMRLPEAAAP